MDSARRVVIHPRYVAALRNTLADAKADLHAMHARHVAELAALRAEVELREVWLLVTSTLRRQAESDVATPRSHERKRLSASRMHRCSGSYVPIQVAVRIGVRG
jgi:hypothetical protein